MDGVEQVRVTVLPDNRVHRRDAARALGRKAKTLAEWKSRGIGPRPIMVGGRVFYDWAEVLAIASGEKPVTAWVGPIAA